MGGVFGRTADEAEDGRRTADGNLIAGGGIHLGKGEHAVEMPAACRGRRLREAHTNVEVEL